jgi:serine/threonine protein kinase/Tol biopolymer transport system component
MAFAVGDRLDHFVIMEPLGSGGMGEVYRATDERLGRAVAIKVLSDEFASDAERLARFQREARVLASLNHPNIAHLYGLETVENTVGESWKPSRGGVSSGTGTDAGSGPQDIKASCPTTFIVMELVEGEDLAERLVKDRLSPSETLAIAKQIAEGLDAAHARGIVHRDLKPANIRIATDGTVKILDFGLAKAWRTPTGETNQSESPTLTAEMTFQGTILGTAPYLSPEQAKGQGVDRRADIWAFGCVLYEMLAGHRAFEGGTSTEIMAHILERDPDWSALPTSVPPALRRLLGRCMEKDPNRRLRDAGDLAMALEDLIEDRSGPLPLIQDGEPESSRTAKIVPWLIAAVAVALGITGWMSRSPDQQREAPSTLRFTEASPVEIDLVRNHHSGSSVAISPDGHFLVWVGATEVGTQLWSRHLDEDESHSVDGTEGGQAPFFSPDGDWIGFWADGKIKKVAVQGGVPQTICEISHVHGPSWGDGIIVMGAVGDGSLYTVDPAIGELERIEIPYRSSYYLADYPRLLLNSRTMLASSRATGSVDLISLDSGEITTLVNEGANASYLPSGHLVWIQEDDLVAAPLDLEKGALTGEARTVIDGVFTETHIGVVSHYAVSDEGTLVYLPGTFERKGASPVWVGLDGTTKSMPIPDDWYQSPRTSPDGQKILFGRRSGSQSIWIADSDRGFIGPLTGDEGHDYWAIWTPDGSHVVYNSQRESEPANVWIKPADGNTQPRRLTTGEAHLPPAEITRNGQTVLVGSATGADDDLDIHQLTLTDEPTLEPLLATDADESHPSLSPDERWIAYASDVTGNTEVYVQRFPNLGGTIRISADGGQEPLWSPSGDRLYFRSTDGRRVYAVDVLQGDPPSFGREELLFEGNFDPGPRWGANWDIHPDGNRFLMLQIKHGENPRDIKVVTNWFNELERLVPTSD